MAASPTDPAAPAPLDARSLGIAHPGRVLANLSAAALTEHAVRNGEGLLTDLGAISALTGPRTGRSPKDKFTVRAGPLTDQIDWDIALREQRGRVNPRGLYDLDRNIRPVGEAFKKLLSQWPEVLPTQSVCLFVPVMLPSALSATLTSFRMTRSP